MRRFLQIVVIGAAVLVAGSVFAQLNVPEIPYDAVEAVTSLPPDIYLGEAVGVATGSKGNFFVYTRTGHITIPEGTNRAFTFGGSRLFEFDPAGKFIREIGQGLYGFSFAHVVRVDPQENIWVVDEGSNMVIKFDQQGKVLMTMGRHPEALRIPTPVPNAANPGGVLPQTIPPTPPGFGGGGREGGAGRGAAAPAAGGGGREGGPAAAPAPIGTGVLGDNFNRPTDVAWDAAGNIFVSDGYGNSRVAKFDKDGKFIKSWGSYGTGPGQFSTLHSIAVDAKGMVYVGDRGNRRIQVFDNDGNFKTMFLNAGAPWAICITPGPTQYLYTSNSNGTADYLNGEIYKMTLDGKIVGKFGTAGTQLKQFGSVHELDCRNENVLYAGEITNWRVQKLTLKPAPAK